MRIGRKLEKVAEMEGVALPKVPKLTPKPGCGRGNGRGRGKKGK